jgi:hypothetical protein
MRTRTVAPGILGALALTSALACATTPLAPPEPPTASAPLGRDFFLRQRVSVRFATGDGSEERHFETALQSRCGELRLVGMTPFGVRLFSAIRRDGNLEVESLGGRPLPFAPEHVLRDVERTFFESPPIDGSGEQRFDWSGEAVTETWKDGLLEARSLVPGDHGGADPISITYSGPSAAAGIRAHIELSNPRFGYVLAIDNHEVEELECPEEASRVSP